MAEIKKICIECGKDFTADSSRNKAKCCSQECANIRRRRQQKKYQKEVVSKEYRNFMRQKKAEELKKLEEAKKNKTSINDDSAMAKKLGISYGEYMSLKWMGKLDEFKAKQFKEMVDKQDIANTYKPTLIGD